MIGPFIESMLGVWGRALLHYLQQNAAVVSLIAVAYGSFMLMCWVTMVRIYRYAVLKVASQIHVDPELSKKMKPRKLEQEIEIPWQAAVEAARFPFVARQGALWPKRASASTLAALVEDREVIDDALKLLRGTPIGRIHPQYRLMRQRELARIGGAKPSEDDIETEAEEAPQGS